MNGWTRHEGLAVGLPLAGVDTDQLIPARFMSRPRSAGYGDYLLHDLRVDAKGTPRPDFPLHAPDAVGASILVARRNFGGGSSREAAVYALADYGIRAVIAPSFGDIFAGNAVNNGLLPARVTEAEAEAMLAELARGAQRAEVDIAAGHVRVGSVDARFVLDPAAREKLINGWDDIDMTGARAAEIAIYRAALERNRPWTWPRAAEG